MKLYHESNLSKQFKKGFLWLVFALIVVVAFSGWLIYFVGFQREADSMLNEKAFTLKKTFSFFLKKQTALEGQRYLDYIHEENSLVKTVLYYDFEKKEIIGAIPNKWVGMGLKDLPSDKMGDAIRAFVDSKQERASLDGNYDLHGSLFRTEKGVTFVLLSKKEVSKQIFIRILITEIAIAFAIFLFFLIPLFFLTPKILAPMQSKLVEMNMASPIGMDKFRGDRPMPKQKAWTIFQAFEQLVSLLQNTEHAQAWPICLCNQIPLGFLFGNTQGKVIYANQKMTELLGINPEQVAGEGWKDSIHPDDYSKITEEWKRVTREHDTTSLNGRVRGPDGFIRSVTILFTPLRSPTDEVIGTLGIFYENSGDSITPSPHKTTISQQKSNLITIISHQLRTPLSVIQQSIEILNGLGEKEQAQEYTEFISVCRNNVNKIIQMIQDTLSFEELEFGFKEWADKELALKPVVEQVFEENRQSFEEKGLGFHLEIKENLPKVLGDEESLKKAITQLVTNGLHFTEQGEVFLRVYQDNEHIVIEVQDTGIGIKQEDRKNLFTLFTQIHSSNMRFGSGLGLVIAQKIVQHHNGVITYDTEFQKGSTFRIVLPIQGASNG